MPASNHVLSRENVCASLQIWEPSLFRRYRATCVPCCARSLYGVCGLRFISLAQNVTHFARQIQIMLDAVRQHCRAAVDRLIDNRLRFSQQIAGLFQSYRHISNP